MHRIHATCRSKFRVLCHFPCSLCSDWVDPIVAMLLYVAEEDCPVSQTLGAAAYQSAARISAGEI